MKIKERTLLVVLGGVIVLLVWLLYVGQARLSFFKNQVSKFDLQKQLFTEILNTDSSIIAEQDQLILNQNDAIRLYGLEVDRLNKVKSQVITVTKTVVDSIFIPYYDTLRLSDTIYPKGMIEVPKRFELLNEHYSIDGIVLLEGVKIDSMSFENKMKITIGDKKMGFFKKAKPIVEIENSNPYMSTLDMKNVVIEDDKKFYDRKAFWLGVGVIGTFVLLNK